VHREHVRRAKGALRVPLALREINDKPHGNFLSSCFGSRALAVRYDAGGFALSAHRSSRRMARGSLKTLARKSAQ
jgi:hypothetical protein